MDYYSILGVPKNASSEQLKKAYKKQSMQHHPDRGGDEAQFKKVNEAYSTLKDPAKRQQYDNPQPQYNFNTSNMGGHPFDDLFAQFGFRQNQRQQPRNPDITIAVEMTIKELFIGKKVLAVYRLRNGQEQPVDLDIPPGVSNGDKIRYPGLGENIIPGPRGNLFVVINILPNKEFDIRGNDVYTIKKVNCLQMIVGTRILITTPDDRNIELTIPPGTKNGTTFSMNGYGVPNTRTRQKGNMLIKIEAEIPKNLSTTQIDQIRGIIDGS